MPSPQIKFNPFKGLEDFAFADLFTPEGLERLDAAFLGYLRERDVGTSEKLQGFREEFSRCSLDEAQRHPGYEPCKDFRCKAHTPEGAALHPGYTWKLTPLEESELILACAPILEAFILKLFSIEDEAHYLQIKTLEQNPVALFKKHFILRRIKKRLHQNEGLPAFEELNTKLHTYLTQAPLQPNDPELAIALLAQTWLDQSENFPTELELLAQWCIQALNTEAGRAITKDWTSFRLPQRIDYDRLVPVTQTPLGTLERLAYTSDEWRLRDGFTLTDPRMSPRAVQDEVNYCIYCHDHDGDFCSKGFPVKKGDPTQGFKQNPFDLTLTGCPLEEKISEMNLLKRDGFTIGALATVMIDNPMCPATGHRICNDCMKACIYQKQDPVNIPQIETSVLIDALSLPWGVEIYDLLTRWNPLRKKQWIMKPYNGLKVLIAGMGPAGFTLAHHLLMEGFAVVGFDGLKVEPFDTSLLKAPIQRFDNLKEALDERIMTGFGGVAEYGITVRWDKNFLKLIYLTLMRRQSFQVFGGVRFGGTLKVDDAWALGFDHLAIAVGAGLPKTLSIPNSLAPGMRQANDFLMALQLGNAAKKASLTNLQIRLPAVIIGGGLTGVDTATEVQAYYITQVEKILARYEVLVEAYDEAYILTALDLASQEILTEFLMHGRLVRAEREQAKAEKRRPNFIKLAQAWGGVTIAYRRSMRDSPAYINNHEELQKAFEEGIYYLEMLEPKAIDLNQYGHSETLICRKRMLDEHNEWITTAEEIRLPARSILAATGTQPNIAYEFEHRGTFNRLGLHYQHYEEELDGELKIAHGVKHCKDPNFGPFTSYEQNDYRVSLIGDSHPVFHGNVVKAIASGMRTYPKILESMQAKLGVAGDRQEYAAFAAKMADAFSATLVSVVRRSTAVVELKIRAPLAAKHFKAGQFYRLQNFETLAQNLNNTLLQIEPLALVAAGLEGDTLKFLVTEAGASSKLCALLKPGEPVSLMGPAGVRYKTAEGQETVLVVGNALSIPVVLSYGAALQEVNSELVYVGYFKDQSEFEYGQAALESVCTTIIWVTEQAVTLKIHDQDYATTGDALDALIAYAEGRLTKKSAAGSPKLIDVDRIYLIGGGELLRRFQHARGTALKPYLVKEPTISGSVYSHMQCMLKGVCAQCLQWQIDPETGARTKAVFSCSWPDQPLEIIDTEHLDARLTQNRLQEHLSNLWVDYLFANFDVQRV